MTKESKTVVDSERARIHESALAVIERARTLLNATEACLDKSKSFVLKCARAFGALIEMRDDPLDKEVPDFIEPSHYHLKALDQAITRRAQIMAMTRDEIVAAADLEAKHRTESNRKSYEEEFPRYQRFIEMREQVQAWVPPTPEHNNLKAFMLEQLEHDCREPKTPEACSPKTPEEWLEEEIRSCNDAVAYHSEQYDRDVQRAKERSAWIRDLKKSLPTSL